MMPTERYVTRPSPLQGDLFDTSPPARQAIRGRIKFFPRRSTVATASDMRPFDDRLDDIGVAVRS
jgi:hypothetical protein